MNITQILSVQKIISGSCYYSNEEASHIQTDFLYASPSNSAGGAGEDTGKSDTDAPQASDDKRRKQDNTGRAEGEDVTNQEKDQREEASITEPDTNLTGDTGNLDIGQTDLGASGTGAEDL
jgi:hypothetical protein